MLSMFYLPLPVLRNSRMSDFGRYTPDFGKMAAAPPTETQRAATFLPEAVRLSKLRGGLFDRQADFLVSFIARSRVRAWYTF